MKHTVSLLLLLSVSGISQCASGAGTYGAGAAASGVNKKSGRTDSTNAFTTSPTGLPYVVTMPTDTPAGDTSTLRFEAEQKSWKITKKKPGEKPYPSWDLKGHNKNEDVIARMVTDSHTTYTKNITSEMQIVPETLTVKGKSLPRYTFMGDAIQRRKEYIGNIPAMAEVTTAAQKDKNLCLKVSDGTDYSSAFIRNVIKDVEKEGTFPAQPKVKEIAGSQETFERQILSTLSNPQISSLTAQQRHIGALLIEEARNQQQAALPAEMHLSDVSSGLAKFGLGFVGATKEQQIKDLLTGLTNARKQTVSPQVWQLLTTVHHPVSTGKNFPLSTASSHEILLDRTEEQSRQEAVLYAMLHLQQLRDAQLAFTTSGDKKELQRALLAREKSRCTGMLATLAAMIKKEEDRTGTTCLSTGKATTQHSLRTVEHTYKNRLAKVTAQEDALEGKQNDGGDNDGLTLRDQDGTPLPTVS